MKKFLALVFALALVVTMLPIMAAAEGTEPEVQTETDQFETDQAEIDNDGLNDSDDPDEVGEEPAEEEENEDGVVLLPDSPFYFLKRFLETVRVWLTFNEDSKTEVLAGLVEERARELAALEQKYADQELTEKQLEMLAKAAEDLKDFAEGFIDRLVNLDADDLEELQLTDEQIALLEQAMTDLGEALDWIGDGEPGDDEEGNYEKYERRIAHLQEIMEKTPEEANKGLSRAIENARRQQARWLERQENGSDDDDEELEEVTDPEGIDTENELEETTIDNDDEGTDTDEDGKDKEVKGNKDKKNKDKTPPGHAIRELVRNRNR